MYSWAPFVASETNSWMMYRNLGPESIGGDTMWRSELHPSWRGVGGIGIERHLLEVLVSVSCV